MTTQNQTANTDTTRADLPSITLPDWALLYGFIAPYALPSLELVAYADNIAQDVATLRDALERVRFNDTPLSEQAPIKQLLKNLAHSVGLIERVSGIISEHHSENERYLWKVFKQRPDYAYNSPFTKRTQEQTESKQKTDKK